MTLRPLQQFGGPQRPHPAAAIPGWVTISEQPWPHLVHFPAAPFPVALVALKNQGTTYIAVVVPLAWATIVQIAMNATGANDRLRAGVALLVGMGLSGHALRLLLAAGELPEAMRAYQIGRLG